MIGNGKMFRFELDTVVVSFEWLELGIIVHIPHSRFTEYGKLLMNDPVLMPVLKLLQVVY